MLIHFYFQALFTHTVVSFTPMNQRSRPMRPKDIEGWSNTAPRLILGDSDPAGVILYVMEEPYRLPFPYRSGCPDRIWWNFELPLYNKCTQSWATLREEGMAWYSSRSMPSLWSRPLKQTKNDLVAIMVPIDRYSYRRLYPQSKELVREPPELVQYFCL